MHNNIEILNSNRAYMFEEVVVDDHFEIVLSKKTARQRQTANKTLRIKVIVLGRFKEPTQMKCVFCNIRGMVDSPSRLTTKRLCEKYEHYIFFYS